MGQTMDSVRILRLEAENFKRLTAIEIETNGEHVVIGGRNRQGKTSTLDAIHATLAGTRHCPDAPIKNGEEEGRTLVELGEIGSDLGIVVERRYTAKGSTLKVTAKDGSRYASAQKMLDAFFSALSFDPAEFLEMAPTKQADTLRSLGGLDFTGPDKDRKAAFDKRTDAARDMKRAQAQLDGVARVKAPEEEISIGDAFKELQRRQATNACNEAKREELDFARRTLRNEKEGLEDDERSLAEAIAAGKQKIEEAKQCIAAAKAAGKKLRAEVDALEDQDVAQAQATIDNAEETNKRVRQAKARAALAVTAKSFKDAHAKLDKKIKAFDEAKAKAIAAAEFPVEGLSVDGAEVTLHGLPFSQASGAEQAQCCVAIASALNPTARFMLVRRGEAMDDESLDELLNAGTAAGVQLIVEVVGPRDATTVMIEDGAILPAGEDSAFDTARGIAAAAALDAAEQKEATLPATDK